jgi:hypothetical protein
MIATTVPTLCQNVIFRHAATMRLFSASSLPLIPFGAVLDDDLRVEKTVLFRVPGVA